uniref:Retrotransposon gag domain-containing protein n=1 Tax=Brassica oleracea var. oleracea TaxID=109376 RepID=A0A0D3CCK9_BRAOL
MFQKLQNLRQGSQTVDEYATEFFKMINRAEVRDSEQHLVMRFVGGLRQQIQLTVNIFRPQTISEAHQKALTVEEFNLGIQEAHTMIQKSHSSPFHAPATTRSRGSTLTTTFLIGIHSHDNSTTTKPPKLQRFGSIPYLSKRPKMHQHSPEHTDSSRIRLTIFGAILGIICHQFPTALFKPRLHRFRPRL